VLSEYPLNQRFQRRPLDFWQKERITNVTSPMVSFCSLILLQLNEGPHCFYCIFSCFDLFLPKPPCSPGELSYCIFLLFFTSKYINRWGTPIYALLNYAMSLRSNYFSSNLNCSVSLFLLYQRSSESHFCLNSKLVYN